MKVYIAGSYFKGITKHLENLRRLDSYFYIKSEKDIEKREPIIDWFLDSGAFSAWNLKKPITIEAYGDFIDQHKHNFDVYANLDAIGDPLQTQKNQEYLESRGLNPLAVFHYGEDVSILKSYMGKYEYIAFGGMVPISTKQLTHWLDDMFDIVCNEKGEAKIKVHGFGMTTRTLIRRYPWYSIDSTSAVLSAAMGRIFSDRGDVDLSRKGGRIPLATQQFVETYMPEYKLEDLCNDYKARMIYNVKYFQKLEKELTENPPRWIRKQMKLL